MNRCLTRIASLGAMLSIACTAAFASSASATYHENLIREVHDGGGVTPDYVMLQAYAPGQNFTASKQVVTYDGGGGPLSHVVLSNVANGSNQATILVGGAGLTGADATDPSFNVVNTGGTVCFAEGTSILTLPTALDCVAYVGSNAAAMFPAVPPASAYGTPLSLGGQDLASKSIVRTIARGCATALDPADDTNNSAADFAIGTPIGDNNATAPTGTVCPPGNPTSSTNPAGKTRKRKCKKKKKHRSAEIAKKKKCKKKK